MATVGRVPGIGQTLGPALALMAMLATPVTFVVQLDRDGRVWETHIIPAMIVLTIALVTRSVNVRGARELGVAAAAVARSGPLLAPLVLVVLVLPALSADLWSAAARLDVFDISLLVLITVVPLGVIVMRELVSELPEVMRTRARVLAGDANRGDRTRETLRDRLQEDAFDVVDFATGTQMTTAWPSTPEEYAPLLAVSEGDALRRPLIARLVLCIVVVAVTLTVYLYAILATVIDPHVARAWSGEPVGLGSVHVLGLTAHLPGSIYVRVVVLLGVIATATFLAFAVLEERFSTALGDALLKLPADRLLVLALPYLALREERLASEDAAFDDWDPGAINQEAASA